MKHFALVGILLVTALLSLPSQGLSSEITSRTIKTQQVSSANVEMVNVPAGTFTMGRRNDGHDEFYGRVNELPRHEVTLSAYRIGKFEVTNGQMCGILNWALTRNYLKNANGAPLRWRRCLCLRPASRCHLRFRLPNSISQWGIRVENQSGKPRR